MNFYTLASKLLKKRKQLIESYENTGIDVRTYAEERIMTEFEDTCQFGIKLMNNFKSLVEEGRNTPHYFLTIRPDNKKIEFETFKLLVEKYIEKSFLSYRYTFEQKGTEKNTLGNGFHCHIIGLPKRSKNDTLKQCINFFKASTAPNCIEILKCNSPDKLYENYLVNYASDDGHKIVTKEWDETWRDLNGLKSVYTNLSSPSRLVEIVQTIP